MKRYSQNNEQDIILNYFKDEVGTFLDLGSYDGVNLSNTRALVRKKWKGVLVDPSPEVFKRLELNCKDYELTLINCAVSDYNDTVSFYDNQNAVATMHQKETERWDNEEFNKIEVRCRDVKELLEELPYTVYDFISIDCEGEDLTLLKRIDFAKYKTRLVCVEWNSKDQNLFDEIMKGWKLIHKNAENLIYETSINGKGS
jgi:FkbM family methyltransferase